MRSALVPASPRGRARWLIGAVVVGVLLIVGGPWLYINVFRGDEPDKLALPAAATSTATNPSAAGTGDAPTSSLEGEWTIGEGSIVGYRVKEILFGQSAEAVGRTNEVEGALTVAGDAVSKADFAVDMTTVKSDKSRRDGQFHGRIMDTESHPTATFTLTKPIAMPAGVAAGSQFTASATGDLTLRGNTKPVSFEVTGQRSGNGFDVTAQIPIVFADFDVPNPSIAGIKTEDHGVLEVLLKLVPKA
jgi:polyisoprenoid-binding protein YceI